MSDLAALLTESILPHVEKPSRYLGSELNSIHKDPRGVDLRVCLAFPDSYDLGLGNLGLQILYHVLNSRDDVWAERVCAPHPDLEALLRERGLPLFALESKTPLCQFDLLGFTLQWELCYTNILNMLDLGGVPVLASERTDAHPLVAAGGPCVFNPEPLALFVDVFVIGDGEEAVLDVADAVKAGGGRAAILDRLAALPGCYVPSRHDGSQTITKRLVRDLDAAPYPTAAIVPFGEQVHDRASLEVLRGCTQGCRFCQAGMVTRPVRERSLDMLAKLQQATMAQTGHEELSLTSLSTCDYSRVKTLVSQSVRLASPDHIAVSLPSLRLDSFSVDLAAQVSTTRKTGLTFAPEAATDRLRRVINKNIPTEDLLRTAEHCYRQGYQVLKLYFMIGLPTETDEDVLAIADLARRVLAVGQSINRKARVNLGVSTFVPKPHTPFQWAAQIPPEETQRRQKLLYQALGSKAIKFGRGDPRETWLEGLIGRADRRGGWLLYYAWRAGARFDGWHELSSPAAWDEALARWQAEFEISGHDLLGERDVEAPLPWDHIDVMIPKAWLARDWAAALAEGTDPLPGSADCRQAKCHQCGVIHVERDACTTMLRRSRVGAKDEADLTLAPPDALVEPPPIGRMRFRWSRSGLVALTSHHELLNVFIRAIRRAKLPLRYSEGFHPHASLSFSSALRVGLETEGDWCDVTLTAEVDPQDFRDRLNATLPHGFEVLTAWPIPMSAKSLMALLTAARYRATLSAEQTPPDLEARVSEYLAQSEIIVQRRGKQLERRVWRPVDIRGMIASLAVTAPGELEMLLVPDAGGRLPKADEVLGSLLGAADNERPTFRLRKLASYQVLPDGTLVEPAPEPVLEVPV